MTKLVSSKQGAVSREGNTHLVFPTIFRGYTLVELIVSIGIFALVMVLASGAYLVMIGLNREAQGTATGIDNLSFALENIQRTIRTGSQYFCAGTADGNCPNGGSSLVFRDASARTVTYSFSGSTIYETICLPLGGPCSAPLSLTDPIVSIDIDKSQFYVTGAEQTPDDYIQPHVTVIIVGNIAIGPGKTLPFTIQTGATMRGPDI